MEGSFEQRKGELYEKAYNHSEGQEKETPVTLKIYLGEGKKKVDTQTSRDSKLEVTN